MPPGDAKQLPFSCLPLTREVAKSQDFDGGREDVKPRNALKLQGKLKVFSPSVGYADSSLVRGSHDAVHYLTERIFVQARQSTRGNTFCISRALQRCMGGNQPYPSTPHLTERICVQARRSPQGMLSAFPVRFNDVWAEISPSNRWNPLCGPLCPWFRRHAKCGISACRRPRTCFWRLRCRRSRYSACR